MNVQNTITAAFPSKSVVIIGDLVADQSLNGTIVRISREAPVFILRHDTTTTRPGGAANAAVNVASIGGKPILIGLAGRDANGESLLNELADASVDCSLVVSTREFQTVTKVRVLAGHHYAARQQMIRIDYENPNAVSDDVKRVLRHNLLSAAQAADAIIFSDYNYGAVFPEIFDDARIISHERGIPLIVDSRFRLANFSNATTATPNREEIEQILGNDFTPEDCEGLRARLGFEALLNTNGNQGVVLYEQGKGPLTLEAVGSSEPVDVTGAGDTVIAAYALGLASGLSFTGAARVANHAGGIVVMKKGTASVTTGELLASLAGDADSLASSNVQ